MESTGSVMTVQRDDSQEKAIVVLTQDEIDAAIHGLEELSWELDDQRFQEIYGDVYKKLHAIEQGEQDSYRVK